MRWYRTLLLTLPLSIVALGCWVLTAYLLSVLSWGDWEYSELIAPSVGSAIAGLLALIGAGYVHRRDRGSGAVVRFTAVATVVNSALAVGFFFVCLSNCTLSCGNKTLSQSLSPNGRLKAVLFSRTCVAAARYCPSVSSVSVLAADDALPAGEGNVVAFVGDVGVDLQWKSDGLLLVRYPAIARVLRQYRRSGDVQIQYLRVGWM